MNRMWGRLGVTFSFTDDEYKKIKKECNIADIVKKAISECRFVIDGDTYFPIEGLCFEDYPKDEKFWENSQLEPECDLYLKVKEIVVEGV